MHAALGTRRGTHVVPLYRYNNPVRFFSPIFKMRKMQFPDVQEN